MKSHPGLHRISKRCTNVDAHIGLRIRAQRQIQRMSQERLASLLGVTFQQVQKYEKGVNRVGAGRLYYIAKILSLPVTRFYDGLAPNITELDRVDLVGGKAVQATEFIKSVEGVQLIKSFRGIKDRQTRKRIIALVKALVRETPDETGDI
jgi:transcriptional regulator with XRE-family HTH domain